MVCGPIGDEREVVLTSCAQGSPQTWYESERPPISPEIGGSFCNGNDG